MPIGYIQGDGGVGTGVTISGTPYHLTMFNAAGNNVEGAGIVRTENGTGPYEAEDTIIFPRASFQAGYGSIYSAFGSLLKAESYVSGRTFVLPFQYYDPAVGSERTRDLIFGPAGAVAGPVTEHDQDVILSGQFTAVIPSTMAIFELLIRGTNGSSLNGFRFRVTVQGQSEPFFYFPTRARYDANDGDDLTADSNGVYTVDLSDAPNALLEGQTVIVEFAADSGTLRGDGSLPFYEFTASTITFGELARLSDLTDMAVFAHATEVTGDITITAANVDTYLGTTNHAILYLRNTTGVIDIEVDDDAFEDGQFLTIKHFDATSFSPLSNRWRLASTGTNDIEHPDRAALESDVVGNQDNAFTWQLRGTDWHLLSSFIHGVTQAAMEDVYVDTLSTTISDRTVTTTLGRTEGEADLTDSVTIPDEFVNGITLDCTNDVLTLTLHRNIGADLTATCNLDGTDPPPTLTNLAINIASRVDLNTDLNNERTVTFDVTGYDQLTALELIVMTGDNKTLTVPTSNGDQSQQVTLSGIDTSSQGTLVFELSGTYPGGTVTSGTVSISIRDLMEQEMLHFGFIPQADAADTIVFADDDISTATDTAGTYTVSGIPDDSSLYRIYFAVPSGFDAISTITQSGFSLNSQFAQTTETFGGETYTVWLFVSGSAVNSDYNGAILTVGE